jgi:hypothetical protein
VLSGQPGHGLDVAGLDVAGRGWTWPDPAGPGWTRTPPPGLPRRADRLPSMQHQQNGAFAQLFVCLDKVFLSFKNQQNRVKSAKLRPEVAPWPNQSLKR